MTHQPTELDRMLEDLECRGRDCNHETADTHYFIGEGEKAAIQALIRDEVVKARIDELSNWEHDVDGTYYLKVNGNNLEDRIRELKANKDSK